MASASQPELDTNLPGVRLLQEWIRVGLVLQLEMANGSLHEGILQWQDPEFLALQSVGSEWPKLIKRSQVSQISSLGLAKEPTQSTIPSSRPCLPPT
jgi:host factor-I protein